MRTIAGCIWFLWGSLSLFGQSAEETIIQMKQEGSPVIENTQINGTVISSESTREDQESVTDNPPSPGPDQTKGHLGVTVGTSFSYMQRLGSGMMFYAAPTYTLPLSQRWALHGGLIAANYQGFYPGFSVETPFPRQFSSLALFAAASYRMNDRLILHGAGVKQLIAAPATPFTPYPADYFSVGATYKLGENISIGATIHLNNGGGYYADPFNRYGFQPPFYW